MFRRALARAGVLAVSVASFVMVEPAPQQALAQMQPNVVVIITDDQRAGTLRWMPIVRSELVRRGTTFTNAYVPTPTCCPSRASILTGLFAQRTGVWANTGSVDGTPIGGWGAFAGAGNEDRTVATWLTATHRTILVGKYLNHYDDAGEAHIPPGWDRWHSFFMRNGAYHDYRLIHTDGSITRHGERRDDYSTDVLADLAVTSIEDTPRKTPLMMFFTPYAPHGPATPAPRHVGLGTHLPRYDLPHVNERDVEDKPPWIQDLQRRKPRRIAKTRQDVYASLQAVDEAVGRILDALERTSRLQDTLIVFLSDNGSSWAEHRLPIADKFVPYTAQMHVPLVIRWDGEVPAGARDPRLAANVDVPVTIARSVGVAPSGVDGRSLFRRVGRDGIPLTASEARAHVGDGISIDRPAYCGFLTARFLYVTYASSHEELYATREDPYELRNRAGDRIFRNVQDRLRTKALDACVPRPPGY
jgi:arylsulfatase A-like enzyme